MKPLPLILGCPIIAISLATLSSAKETGSITFKGDGDPGAGKKVVPIAEDEEYRSEQFMSMFSKILSSHYGFTTTVLFSTGVDDTIDPNNVASMSNPEALDSVAAIVVLICFRTWPDEPMKHFDAAIRRGVPVIALRTSADAFRLSDTSAFKDYNSFGKKALGELWVSHRGQHRSEAARAVIEAANAKNPLLNGAKGFFGDSDVYEAAPLAAATILTRGQVPAGMMPTSASVSYSKKGVKPVEMVR